MLSAQFPRPEIFFTMMQRCLLKIGSHSKKSIYPVAARYSSEAIASAGKNAKTIAAFAAFASRTGILIKDPKTMLDSVTHKSFVARSEDSDRYQLLGSNVLSLVATEYVLAKYPNLPSDAALNIVNSFIGDFSLADVGRIWGVQFILRAKTAQGQTTPTASPAVRAWVVQSIIGALYKEQGASASRTIIHKHILSRAVDVQAHVDLHVKMRNPRRLLVALAKKLKQTKPVARLLKETGRHSVAPVFIVGMYSDAQKIGEGHGSSLQMAETRVYFF